MTEADIRLVKSSWRKLMHLDPEILGDLFYTKLFTEYPSLRKLFPKDMREQNKKLIDMLTSLVGSMEGTGGNLAELHKMGKRHEQYGVKPGQYEMVGSTLLWTLAQGLGDDWNEALRDAWIECYKFLTENMLSSGHSG